MLSGGIKAGVFLLCFLLISGCSLIADTSNTIEEIAPTIMLYINENPKGQLQLSSIVPALRKQKKRVISTTVGMIKQGKYLMDLKYYRELTSGQVRMVFVSKMLAQRHLSQVINTLLLDPEISDRVFLAVVEGDVIGYWNRQLQNKEEQLDLYMYKMFSHYEKQGITTIINVHQFMESLYNPYADPVMPYFSVNGDQMAYQGTALFQGYRMVDVIPRKDDAYFQMLRHLTGQQETVSLNALNTTFGQVRTVRRIHFGDSINEVTINVEMRARVEEYNNNWDLSDSAGAALFTSSVDRQIESNMETMIHRIQSHSVDPFAFGEHTLGWMHTTVTGGQWKKRWPKVRVNVRAHLSLENSGMLKKEQTHLAPLSR